MPEVAQPTAEGAPDLGEPFGPEYQQRYDEDQQQVSRLNDVGEHSLEGYRPLRCGSGNHHAGGATGVQDGAAAMGVWDGAGPGGHGRHQLT